MPRLSIIVVNYNTAFMTRQCIDSVLSASAGLDVEVIVVDNGSQDGSQTSLPQAFPGIHMILNRQNRGFAGANNDALRVATGEFILLLNSDTIVEQDALRGMVEFLARHPRAGAVGVQLIDRHGSPQTSFARFHSALTVLIALFPVPALLPQALRRRYGPHVQPTGGAPFPVDYASGAALMTRRVTIQEVGLLDEDYFMYSEEMDWCWRMWRHGWRVYGLPHLRIIHLGGGSSTGQAEWRTRQLAMSRALFLRKNRSRWYLALSSSCLLAFLLACAGLFTVASGLVAGRSRRLARKAAQYRQLVRLEWAVAMAHLPPGKRVARA
jgi:GT2 family glycosyltransferase